VRILVEDQKNTNPESGLTDEQAKTDIEDSDKNMAVFPPAIQDVVQDVVNDLPQEARTKVTELVKKIIISASYTRGNAPVDLDLLKQQDAHQFQIAVQGIEASRVDRHETRNHDLVKYKIAAGIVAGVALLLVVLAGIAMFKDQTAFISELSRAVAYCIGGAGGSVIIFRRRKD
jgi:hypothetical protein